jgi:hypothetical protein
MNRLLVLALVASIGNVSVAYAGESLLSSGARHVQQIAAADTAAPAAAAGAAGAAMPTVGKKTETAALQDTNGTLSKSGMSKSKKALLYLGIAAGFVAGVYAIDHGVVDATPSSLGTRQD